MLHVTNGDVAAERLRAASLPGEVLPWRDVLHEGPLPSGLDAGALRHVRVQFIATAGWAPAEAVLADMKARDAKLEAEREEIVLWFEPDLYDQLHLLQVVAQAPAAVPISFILTEASLGATTPERLQWLFPHRPTAGAAFHRLLALAWSAVRAPTPVAIEKARPRLNALPTVQHALGRLLEELPDTRTGLARTERQILDALSSGARTGVAVFEAQQQDETYPFLGDTIFHFILKRLGAGSSPLLETDAGAAVPQDDAWRHTLFQLTPAGRRVRAGEQDWLALAPPERWVGGVLVDGAWRWNSRAGRVSAVG